MMRVTEARQANHRSRRRYRVMFIILASLSFMLAAAMPARATTPVAAPRHIEAKPLNPQPAKPGDSSPGETSPGEKPAPATPTQSPDKPDKPALSPAAASDVAESDPTAAMVVSNSQQAAVLARIRSELAAPDARTDPAAVQKQLDNLINDAGQLAAISEPGPLKFQALSLQMQALNTRIQRWPTDPQIDRLLFRLRAAARRTKALKSDAAPAVADFWLMMADLFDINRLNLPADQQRKQTQELFDAYLVDHGTGPTSDAVRDMLTRLADKPPTPTPPAPANPAPGGDSSTTPTTPTTNPSNPTPPTPPGKKTSPDTPTPTPSPSDIDHPKPPAPMITPPPSPGSEATPQATGANQSVQITPLQPGAASAGPAGADAKAGIEPAFRLGEPVPGIEGVTRYPLLSRFQAGENYLRVLRPDAPFDATRKLRVLFVLPVEAGLGQQFGDGMETVKRLDLHNKYNLLVIAPTFSQLPWYANHPTDADVQQESYMIKAVVPAVDKLFPQAKRRLLLGFSKSGWGAMSLLLRYRDLFDAAAAWDAPLMKQKPDNYGMGPIFGTQKNFDLYNLTHQFRENAPFMQDHKRIILLGYDHFRDDMRGAHELLDQLHIPHDFADGPQRRHHWDSGWVPQAVEDLVQIADQLDRADAAAVQSR